MKTIRCQIEFENGFPTERTIKCLLSGYGIDFNAVTFSDEFGLQEKCSIHWKKEAIGQNMSTFKKFLEFNDIEIKNFKTEGQYNSITFKQKDSYLCED
jgi:hypothetical protein